MIYLVFAALLILTIVVEGAVVALLFRRGRFVYYSLLCNLLTNPAMNLLLLLTVRALGPVAYIPGLIVLEIVVVFVEAWVYKTLCAFKFGKALWVSALVNAVSLSAGLLLGWLLEAPLARLLGLA